MKKLEDYLLTRKTERTFRIKFAFQPKDNQIDRLERFLRKYDLVEISPVSKTIFQTNPKGFDIKNTEIWVVDVVLGFPVFSVLLKEEIRNLLGIHDNYLVVYCTDEEPEEEPKEDESHDKTYLPKGDKPALSSDPDYSEMPEIDPTDHYGDKYNEQMIKAFKEEGKKLDKKYGKYSKYDYPTGAGLFPEPVNGGE